MKIYFISGLGADERVFKFLDLPGIEKVFIKWVRPDRDEPLDVYARRLIDQINTNEEVVLVGVSFGGIIAQEIGRIINCKKLIIISSIKTSKEFGWQFTLLRQFPIHKLLPARFLKHGSRLSANYYFSTKSKEETILLQEIIEDTDMEFMAWAISRIMNWVNHVSLDNIVHIHGTNDRIFPVKPIQGSILIKDGGHFMIVNKWEEISRIILMEIKK